MTMTALKEFPNTEESLGFINDTRSPLLLDFYAPWCGPCKAMAPALEQLAKDHGNTLAVLKVNIDEQPELAQAFGVRAVPTLVYMKDGATVKTHTGAMPLGKLKELVA